MEKRSSWLRALALIMLMVCLPQSAAMGAQKKAATLRAVTEKAVMYAKAKTSSKKLATLKAGSIVQVVSEKGKWAKVKYGGEAGYVKRAAFTKKPTPTPKPKPTSKPTPTPTPKGDLMLVVAEGARLYGKASSSSGSSAVPQGETVRVISVSGNWCKASYGGKSGYMPAKSFQATAAKATKMYKKAEGKGDSAAVKKGAKLMVMEMGREWTKVRAGKRTGYVQAKLLTLPGDEPAATATPKPTAEPTLAPTPGPMPTPTPAPADKGSRKLGTAMAARMYQRASISAKSVPVKAGTMVSIHGEKGAWYKVKIGGKGGYMRQSAFVAPELTTPAPTQAPPEGNGSYKTLKTGSRGSAVTELQRRLEALGYLDILPNGKYASTTAAAVKEFQGVAGLKRTGIADNRTQQALYDGGAPKSEIYGAKLQTSGNGTYVKRLQMRLRTKGYAPGSINGKFGEATEGAVKRFQIQTGLKADGIAGRSTLGLLFSAEAPAYDGTKPAPTPTPSPTATPAPMSPSPTAKPPSGTKKQNAEKVIAAAMAKLGRPYVFGASGPNSFDCSGLMIYAYATAGVSLPHSAYQQGYFCGTKVSRSELQRGDLVFWNTVSDSDLCDHVGIYLGNGQAIHASSGTGRVIISSIDTGYYERVFSWGRAVL